MAQAQMQQTKASMQPAQPMGAQAQPMGEKKSKWWLWVIIAAVIVALGVGAYFWLM